MNRNLTKLKKIFSCCGKICVKNTNGEALDDLLELAEKGELGGGSVSTKAEIEVYSNVVKIIKGWEYEFLLSMQDVLSMTGGFGFGVDVAGTQYCLYTESETPQDKWALRSQSGVTLESATTPCALKLINLNTEETVKENVVDITKYELKNLITECECVYGYDGEGTIMRLYGGEDSNYFINASDKVTSLARSNDTPEIDISLFDFFIYQGSGRYSYYKYKESYTTDESFEWA